MAWDCFFEVLSLILSYFTYQIALSNQKRSYDFTEMINLIHWLLTAFCFLITQAQVISSIWIWEKILPSTQILEFFSPLRSFLPLHVNPLRVKPFWRESKRFSTLILRIEKMWTKPHIRLASNWWNSGRVGMVVSLCLMQELWKGRYLLSERIFVGSGQSLVNLNLHIKRG